MKVAYKNSNDNMSDRNLFNILNAVETIEMLDLVPSRGNYRIDAPGHEMHKKQVRLFGKNVCIKITARSFHKIGELA